MVTFLDFDWMLVIIAEFSVRNTQEKMHVGKGSVEEGGESTDITTPPTELLTTDPPTESAVFRVS